MSQLCPNCEAGELTEFHSAAGIPAHCVQLKASEAEARAVPRGDLLLGHCPACGFVGNMAFDPSLPDYTPGYEETQHYSARFRQFAERLCRTLIERYGIRHKRVFEIGCGKAEFLSMLAELGENEAMGVDPSCDPARLPAEAAKRVRLIRDYFRPEQAEGAFDLVACRHTFEHVGHPAEFMRMLMQAVGDDSLVFIEVPDLAIVLREQRFWDVYYEHCAYFTPGALARLVAGAGLEILEIARDYDDQYVWIIARRPQPSVANEPKPLGLELADDLAATTTAVEAFRRECPRAIAGWRERIAGWHGDGERTVIWGAGSKCVAFVSTCGLGEEIDYIVDINPFKQGRFLPGSGHAVYVPDHLRVHPPARIVAMNSIYRQEIAEELARLGVEAELITV